MSCDDLLCLSSVVEAKIVIIATDCRYAVRNFLSNFPFWDFEEFLGKYRRKRNSI